MNKINENRISKSINQVTIFIFSLLVVMFSLWLVLLPITKYNGSVLFTNFFYDPFVSSERMKEVFLLFGPFLIGSLAVLICLKMGIINLGISGQMSCAALTVYFIGYAFNHAGNDSALKEVPIFLKTIILFLAGVISATILSLFCGSLKVFFNVNEVLSTIITNYFVYYIFRHLVTLKNIVNNTNLGTKENLGDTNFNYIFWIFSIAFILSLVIYFIALVILQKTKWGLMIGFVGLNIKAARYGGIDIKKTTLNVFLISGILGGIAGILYYFRDPQDTYLHVSEALPNNGFDTITIVWLSQSSIYALPITSFFVALIRAQQKVIETSSLDPVIVEILIGLLILSIAFLSKKITENENFGAYFRKKWNELVISLDTYNQPKKPVKKLIKKRKLLKTKKKIKEAQN